MACRPSVASAILIASVAACGIRTPGPIDVDALVKRRGPVEARRELEIQILAHPREIGPRLALAAVDDQLGRPSEAIEQLETVDHLGGPLGTRWRAEDRARLARLIAARARVRLARSAPSAVEDLERARELGANIDAAEMVRARIGAAIVDLRHVDAGVRARGKQVLASLGGPVSDGWQGARPGATPAERGRFGQWLVGHGALRAGWEELSAWHDVAGPASDDELRHAYLRALIWWSPVDAPSPPAVDLVSPEGCRFRGVPGCEPATLAKLDAGVLPPVDHPTTDPGEAAAWAELTLVASLNGQGTWGALLASRVDVRHVELARVPAFARPVFARLAGHHDPGVPDAVAAELGPQERLVVAAERVLDGASTARVATALGPLATTAHGAALLRIVEPSLADGPGEPRDPPHDQARDQAHDQALVAFLHAHGGDLPRPSALLAAYRRDPVIADRLARDAVAEAVDSAVAHASLGLLFDALGDPARARAAWQAAVDASPEPAYVASLAEAIARAGDPDAALIAGYTAAAASGDPATTWLAIARDLHAVGKDVHALEAARNAIDLAGADAITGALDLAIAASTSLGRSSQASSLAERRARIVPAVLPAEGDPTDSASALAAFGAHADGGTIARLWVASRWNPRDVSIRAALLASLEPEDPRRRTVVAELAMLAAGRDPAAGRAAVRALR